jgi:hypothetical protein
MNTYAIGAAQICHHRTIPSTMLFPESGVPVHALAKAIVIIRAANRRADGRGCQT